MKKINIAELLKDCPKDMELNCFMYEDVYFDYVDELNNIHCYIQQEFNKTSVIFNQDGTPTSHTKSKCVIFPKYKTTWEGFVPSCEFKDGDIVADELERICIYKNDAEIKGTVNYYCGILSSGDFKIKDEKHPERHFGCIEHYHLATKEEKTKLFDAIKANGYKWNSETKTLEKLVEPKFKVGDEIVKRNSISNSWIVSSVSSEYYGLKSSNGIECIGVLSVSEQDNYEILLKTDKFDVTNFKPFMKVLVRSDNSDVWECDFFSSYNPKCSNSFHCIGAWYNICIPYIGNEHLRGTTDDCDEFYKNW